MLASVWNKVVKRVTPFSFFDIFWLGLCVTGALLSIISLFFPINIYVLLVFIGISVVYCIIRRKNILSHYSKVYQEFLKLSKWDKIASMACLGVIILFSLVIPYNIPTLHDIGLYHLQSLMWLEEYSVVPGLGNLHGRLAFNSNSLLLSTLFSYHPDSYPVFFALPGLCLFVFSSWLIVKIRRLKSNISAIVLYTLLFIFIFIFRHAIPTTSTDLLAGIFVLYIILGVALRDDTDRKMFVLCIMSVFCITLKLSTAPILLAALVGIIYFIRQKNLKPIYFSVLIGAIIVIPWCIRFVILSGYLIYPFPAIDLFDVDWKMPEAMVVAEKNAAYAWARIQNVSPDVVLAMPFYEWIPRWIPYQSLLTLGLFLLAFVSPVIILIRKKFFLKKKRFFVAWAVAFCGMLFGFIAAPDIRFSLGFVLGAAFIPFILTSFILNVAVNFFYRGVKYIRVAVIILGGVLLLGLSLRQFVHYEGISANALYTFFVKAQSIDNIDTGKEIKYNEHRVDGIIIYYPDKGDQCFDQPLPCTPYPNNRLEMRGGSLQNGFRIKK
jgi:hypothetical protein